VRLPTRHARHDGEICLRVTDNLPTRAEEAVE